MVNSSNTMFRQIADTLEMPVWKFFGPVTGHIKGHKVGLELELEGLGDKAFEIFGNGEVPNFSAKTDGSLQGGAELVSVLPMSFDMALDSVDCVFDTMRKHRLRPRVSHRTSTHVHLNMQDKTMRQVYTFAACFGMLENLLTAWCGEDRDGNLFCLRTCDAKAVVFEHRRVLRGGVPNYNDSHRSMALNFAALPRFGTLELRCMGGAEDATSVKKWLMILEGILTVSESMTAPCDAVRLMSSDGFDALIDTLVPDPKLRAELKAIEGWEDKILDSARATQIWASTAPWDKYREYILDNPFPADAKALVAKTEWEIPPEQLRPVGRSLFDRLPIVEMSDTDEEDNEEGLF